MGPPLGSFTHINTWDMNAFAIPFLNDARLVMLAVTLAFGLSLASSAWMGAGF